MGTRLRARPDLLTWPLLGPFLRWRHSRTAVQLLLLAGTVALLAEGLGGPPTVPPNLTGILIWVLYRGVLFLSLLLVGNAFCFACPFLLPRELARRLRPPRRPWPRALRHKGPALLLFGLLLFAYERFGLWATPRGTALLILLYFAGALLVDGLFRGAPFCKHLCPLGAFNVLTATLSPWEVAVRDPQACRSCRTKDCIVGRGDQRGCELALFQERKIGNLDCTFCLDCVHACPHDNVGVLLRRPGAELATDRWRAGIGRLSRRPDLAALALLFTFGALLNAFAMVRPARALERGLAARLGIASETAVLALLFLAGLVLLPLLLVGAAALLSGRWARPDLPLLALASRFSVALLPLGAGVWGAHYLLHALGSGRVLWPALQARVLAWTGRPLLGEPRWGPVALLPPAALSSLEVLLLALGGGLSLALAWTVAGEVAPRRRAVVLPWALLILLLLGAAFWILGQPMEMRGAMPGMGG